MNSGYWSIFDNFRLYFYGGKGTGEVTAIQTLHQSPSTLQPAIYDLQGRKVKKPTKGLYIVDGKKVLIK
jgi:hypothetical protein